VGVLLICLMTDNIKCAACKDSFNPGSKNKRRNPSILIQHLGKNILIDCGKTFREGQIEMMLKHHYYTIDGLIITHSHADAVLGLDDLREWTEANPIPIFCRYQDFEYLKVIFPYLVDNTKATGSGYVSRLNFYPFDEKASFIVHGIKFTPLLLDHGPNNTALGFKFGSIVYLSDLNDIPETTRKLIENEPIDILIIDALRVKEKKSFTL